MKAAFLVAAVLATTGAVFHFAAPVHAGRDSGRPPAVRKSLASESLSLPLFFERSLIEITPL